MPSDSEKQGNGGYQGEYSAPKSASTTIRGSFTNKDSAGVEDGLSARSDLDSENLHDFKINNTVDPISGNPRQSIKPRASKSVKEKGHSFQLC